MRHLRCKFRARNSDRQDLTPRRLDNKLRMSVALPATVSDANSYKPTDGLSLAPLSQDGGDSRRGR
jgi:hypothetical protein